MCCKSQELQPPFLYDVDTTEVKQLAAHLIPMILAVKKCTDTDFLTLCSKQY